MEGNKTTYHCPYCGQMVMIRDGGGGSPGGGNRSLYLLRGTEVYPD